MKSYTSLGEEFKYWWTRLKLVSGPGPCRHLESDTSSRPSDPDSEFIFPVRRKVNLSPDLSKSASVSLSDPTPPP